MSQRTLKICLLGDRGAGKTCLVRRFAYNTFARDTLPSTALTVSSKTIVLKQGGVLAPTTLVLWDPASSLHSPLPYAAFLDNAAAVVLVIDPTQPNAAAALAGYAAQVRRHGPAARLAIAIAKADAGLQTPNLAHAGPLSVLAGELGASLYCTSALRDLEIDTLFRSLAMQVAQEQQP